jgi:hypothetical protein
MGRARVVKHRRGSVIASVHTGVLCFEWALPCLAFYCVALEGMDGVMMTLAKDWP